jgi:hypothetical protein
MLVRSAFDLFDFALEFPRVQIPEARLSRRASSQKCSRELTADRFTEETATLAEKNRASGRPRRDEQLSIFPALPTVSTQNGSPHPYEAE